MDDYSPESLPDVSSLEIVDLRGVAANCVTDYMIVATDAPVFSCDDERVAIIARLWRELPVGEAIRCHVPPVEIRFYVGDAVVCEASICWRCENLMGFADGEPFGYCFDPQSKAGRQLFDRIKEIVGADVLGDG